MLELAKGEVQFQSISSHSVSQRYWHPSHPRLYERTVREKEVRRELTFNLPCHESAAILLKHIGCFKIFIFSILCAKNTAHHFSRTPVKNWVLIIKIFALALKESIFLHIKIIKCYLVGYFIEFVFCRQLSNSCKQIMNS